MFIDINIESERKQSTLSPYYVPYFKKVKNASEMHKKNYAICGEGYVNNSTCEKWFAKLHDVHSRIAQPSSIETYYLRIINVI